MERNSTLDRLRDMGMPPKPIGLLKINKKRGLSKREIMSRKRIDDGKSSVRKASSVSGASTKISNNRNG